MSNKCEICGKGSMSINKVSHSNRKTRSISKPNLQRVKGVVDGRATRLRVCTRCIRSGRIEKRPV
ncbi:MAG: 50S ribosomal protein L28 [Proteobacteria bacterium]|nr:50S ribosomal protein L28 [Pseudomonadota bacterium]NLN62484.1 50S ribosomal protein L28 [Myxococcales bacterium]